MSADGFDALTKSTAKAVTRRKALLGLAAGMGGALLALFGGTTALAAPRTCVTCICGVGRPCNPKSTTCTEVRAFPAEQACSEACARQNQQLCGQGQTFHCPHGCPA